MSCVYSKYVKHIVRLIDFAGSKSMTEGSGINANAGITPRVFISYARVDGEPFATKLRQRLEAEHIPLWQDRVGLEGGKDWWRQITEALEKVEFLVLVMTPAAMNSETVRKEWRYARQQGVCVFPVKGVPDLDFNSMLHWMRSAHFYDLEYEWPKLVSDLNTRCQQTRVPFMVEDLPPDYVPRPQEFEALIEKLLDQQREEPVAITSCRTGGHRKGSSLPGQQNTRAAYAAEADLGFAEQRMPADAPLRLLTHNFTNMGHLLNLCSTYTEIAPVLYSRLVHLQELSDLCQAFERDIPRPYLASWHQLPDLPDPALLRTLSGQTSFVNGCAISPAGDFIVSASADQTLKVWDVRKGEERQTLRGHTGGVNGCAISPLGDIIVSASSDKTLKVWDALTGKERLTLNGHTDRVNGCVISPAGDSIVSASWDNSLKVWGTLTGEERLTLNGHKRWVTGCAISPLGDCIVSASDDRKLKVWDARSGKERLTLSGHTNVVSGCAISTAGDTIVSA
jgi:WD40 repeat protein